MRSKYLNHQPLQFRPVLRLPRGDLDHGRERDRLRLQKKTTQTTDDNEDQSDDENHLTRDRWC
jgi:hypothetical protein